MSSSPRHPDPGARTSKADGRAVAFRVLRRVFEDEAWADRALHGEAEGLEPRERALATRLVYGAVQRRGTLDWLIEAFTGRPLAKLDPPVVAALRLGLFQLGWMDRVPPHAVVSASVELTKQGAPGGAGLVNAVLRRATRELPARLASLGDATPAEAARKHSHPEWIAQLWFDALDADTARSLMAADNEPAEASLRVNTLRGDREALAARLPVPTRTDPVLPDALLPDGPFDAFASSEWEEGLFMPQSRAAMAVGVALAPQPGERVLDLCAAPGGKTTHLAALMGNSGEVVAVERHPGRAEALRATAARMGASCVTVRTADATTVDEEAAYDRVLVDPPCSDLGTLASRPDARWRKHADDPPRLAVLQRRILEAGARALRPGGTLVFSTCTISPAENEELVAAFLAEHAGEFAADDLGDDHPVWKHPRVPAHLLTLPHRDRTDGFFIARLRRAT